MSEWQPISNFPQDGNDYLVCNAEYASLYNVVAWDDGNPAFPILALDGPNYQLVQFTHWMPLPPPPEPQGDRK